MSLGIDDSSHTEKFAIDLKDVGMPTDHLTERCISAVAVETGEEMDTDLWMLVEELRDQNRNLIEELRSAQGGAAPKAAL